MQILSKKSLQLHFHKYSGAGNDFLLFEDFAEDFPLSQSPKLCHRHHGIGADGLILARHSHLGDFEMVYFNADGSLGEMCGNGLRCFVHFLRDLGHIKDLYQVEIGGNVLTVKCEGAKISTFLPWPRVRLDEVHIEKIQGFRINTGVPHLVLFIEEEVDVERVGRELRHHSLFHPEGVNVNFVRVQGKDELQVRTYERGVERETLACGTGAAAAALVANEIGKCGREVKVITRSKEILEVRLGEEIEIIGPSVKIFEGSIRV